MTTRRQALRRVFAAAAVCAAGALAVPAAASASPRPVPDPVAVAEALSDAGVVTITAEGTGTGAAANWSALMYRSLNVSTTAAQLRTVLAAQKAAIGTTAAAVTTAQSASIAAQAAVAPAATVDAAARAQQVIAGQAYITAKRNAAKLKSAKSRQAVSTALATLNAHKAQAAKTSAALTTAQNQVTATALALSSATAAATNAAAAVDATQQKIAGLPSAADLAAQARAVGLTVIAQTRAGFTTADTTDVYGITINKTMAYELKRMIDAAKADGIVLSGGGFRTEERQIELRTINGCPDVWSAPSSSCRVPTAIPGRSLHEIGLAVDFSQGGRTISAKNTGFTWLKAHAATYGFINLPAEAWHWSITGN